MEWVALAYKIATFHDLRCTGGSFIFGNKSTLSSSKLCCECDEDKTVNANANWENRNMVKVQLGNEGLRRMRMLMKRRNMMTLGINMRRMRRNMINMRRNMMRRNV